MAHYALLDENNIVTQVIVGKDENEPLPEGYESWEQYYGGKQTSYNTIGNVHLNGGTPFRANFAGIGYKYDADLDVFIAPQPYPSWKLNHSTFIWEPPTPKPPKTDDYFWAWSEYNNEWVKITIVSA